MGLGPTSPLPALPARRPPTGLVATAEAAQLLVDEDGPWLGGFEVEPEACNQDNAQTVDPCDRDTERQVAAADQAASLQWEPVEVTSGDICTSMALDGRDARGRAERALASCESHQLAAELWAGTVATASTWPNRFLADVANVDIVTEAGEAQPLDALACLEQALADCNCGQRGMIHATPQTVTHWTRLNLIRRQGPLMLSPNDHYVVADAGYPGTSPDGEIPASIGSVWAYATGLVQVRRGPVTVLPETDAEAVDRTNNVRVVRANRLMSAWWDGCCHAAARIDIEPCDIGGS